MDKKGRLLGKISIIDILIIVLLLVVIGGFFYKNVSSNPVVSYSNGQPATITLKLTAMPAYYLDALSEGNILYNLDAETIGEIKKVTSQPNISLTSNYTGATQIKKVPVADLVDIYVELAVSCFEQDMAYMINGETPVSVGTTITLQNAQVYLADAQVQSVTFVS